MATLTAPSASRTEQPARHGKARLFITINEAVYALIPLCGKTRAWKLVAKTGARTGATYTATVISGEPVCSCPDHAERGYLCKHLMALTASRLLTARKPGRKGGARRKAVAL